MEITEVRVALREVEAGRGAGERRLKAYATVTFDHCFVVRNIKIIEGKNGLFVAMPSHKPKVACAHCQFKNALGGRYCTQCGAPLSRPVSPAGEGGVVDAQAHRDIAHPITVEFRQYLQQAVLAAYEAERARDRVDSTGRTAVVEEAG
jgi:stage V sporulation protein G